VVDTTGLEIPLTHPQLTDVELGLQVSSGTSPRGLVRRSAFCATTTGFPCVSRVRNDRYCTVN